jgi:hypothetical protein
MTIHVKFVTYQKNLMNKAFILKGEPYVKKFI